MSRLLLEKGQQRKFIGRIKAKSGLSLRKIGEICKKNPKSISDWGLEKSTIPYETAIILSKKFSIQIPNNYKQVADFWHTSKAGKKGWLANIKKHGNPGTSEGRRLGGLKSQITHDKLNTDFKRLLKIKVLKKKRTTG